MTTMTTKKENGRYVIIRSTNAGCFAGELHSRNGDSVVLLNSRRLWFWSGAASLSQLAMEGTKDPNSCKFPCTVDSHEIFGVIEILDTTPEARQSIQGVPVWKK